MPLVCSKELLLDAQKNRYAIGAFNVENMEMIQAVIAAAEAENAPVIMQTTPSTLRYADTSLYSAMAKAAAEKSSVPVAIHLDHGSYEHALKCIEAGFSSVKVLNNWGATYILKAIK